MTRPVWHEWADRFCSCVEDEEHPRERWLDLDTLNGLQDAGDATAAALEHRIDRDRARPTVWHYAPSPRVGEGMVAQRPLCGAAPGSMTSQLVDVTCEGCKVAAGEAIR